MVPTGLMSILICIVFCLPTAAGEKMTLCMSILLALNLFQLLVTKILPPTSAVVPLIAKYLLFTFTLNVLVIGKKIDTFEMILVCLLKLIRLLLRIFIIVHQ
jgi:nicotinic acetylcholine receptor